MGSKVKNWIPTILAGLTLIIEIALNILDINIQGALWLTVTLLVTQIFIFHRELVEIKNKKPNIVVDGFKQERPFHLRAPSPTFPFEVALATPAFEPAM